MPVDIIVEKLFSDGLLGRGRDKEISHDNLLEETSFLNLKCSSVEVILIHDCTPTKSGGFLKSDDDVWCVCIVTSQWTLFGWQGNFGVF